MKNRYIEVRNSGELVLLQKMIEYVKFVAVDEQSSVMASNSCINALHDKVNEQIKSYRKWVHSIPAIQYLRENRHIKEMVIKKLINCSELDGLEREKQKHLVLTMVYPYVAAETELEEIIDRVEKVRGEVVSDEGLAKREEESI